MNEVIIWLPLNLHINCMCLSQIIKLLNVKTRVNAMSAFNKTLPAPYEVALYLTYRKTLRIWINYCNSTNRIIQRLWLQNQCNVSDFSITSLSHTAKPLALTCLKQSFIVYYPSLFHCSVCFLFFPLVMIHRCASALAWKHFMFTSPIFFLSCKRSLDATCVTGIWMFGASWEIPFFVFVSFQPAGKNTILKALIFITSAMMKESRMQVKYPWYLKSPDSITLNTEPLSHVSAVIVPQLWLSCTGGLADIQSAEYKREIWEDGTLPQ